MENIENIKRRQKILSAHFYYRKKNFFQIFTDKKLTRIQFWQEFNRKVKAKNVSMRHFILSL